MDLAIIIVGWNVADLLLNCLQSIYQNPPTVSFEVWVVDNASSDDTLRRVRERFPQVRLLANERNRGFAGANNQAIQGSQSRYVLLLNPDTLVFPGTLQALVDYLDSNAKAGAAGSLYTSPDGSLQVSCMPYPTVSRELWRLFHLDNLLPYGVYAMQGWDRTRPRRVDGLQGASLMLRRSALDQCGLLDEAYFMYTEEVDLCYRLHRGGWELYWVPSSRIIHYGGQSTAQVAREMFLQLYRSKVLFFRKNYSSRSATAYKAVLWLAAQARLSGSFIAASLRPGRRSQDQTLQENYRYLLASLPQM